MRRKVLFDQGGRHLGEVFHGLAQQKVCKGLEENPKPDHVHICISIVASTGLDQGSGSYKGKMTPRFSDLTAGK